MADMSLTKHLMPVLAPKVRCTNFEEVALGYDSETAIAEAKRCLNCKHKPCIEGCPVKIHIPEFIAEVAEGNFEKAYEIISQSSSLPAVCGRVCPQETQCEQKCVRGIKGEPVGIGYLERFVADYHAKNKTEANKKIEATKGRVAVIGSGPAGLSCAGELAKRGYEVTIYEALHAAGGVLTYGIPEFRLPKTIVSEEIEGLKQLGVKIETNVVIGRTILIDELFSDYDFDAVFIGSGAGLPKFMNIEGEELKGVYSANEFLTRINLMKGHCEDTHTPVKLSKKTVVVGGGNVAMDAARCAKRLGADVSIVYRRTKNELPARKEEVEHAIEEGIEFKFLTNPVKILGDENGFANKIVCRKMQLSEPDASGRARPVEVEGSDFEIEADSIIMALGTSPNPIIRDTTEGLETAKWGGIIANDETGLTSKEGVFAGGDAVSGAATVILAMGAGKNAANAIDEYISSKK